KYINTRDQDTRPHLRLARFIACPTDGGHRNIDAALRETQKREPRFRRFAMLAGRTIRTLSFGELTAQSIQLAELIERQSNSGLMWALGEAFAGTHRFAHC